MSYGFQYMGEKGEVRYDSRNPEFFLSNQIVYVDGGQPRDVTLILPPEAPNGLTVDQILLRPVPCHYESMWGSNAGQLPPVVISVTGRNYTIRREEITLGYGMHMSMFLVGWSRV